MPSHVDATKTGSVGPSARRRWSPSVEAPAPSAITAASGTPYAAARSPSSAPIDRPTSEIRRASTPGWRAKERHRAGDVVAPAPAERVRLAATLAVPTCIERQDPVSRAGEHSQVRERRDAGVVRSVQEQYRRTRSPGAYQPARRTPSRAVNITSRAPARPRLRALGIDGLRVLVARPAPTTGTTPNCRSSAHTGSAIATWVRRERPPSALQKARTMQTRPARAAAAPVTSVTLGPASAAWGR